MVPALHQLGRFSGHVVAQVVKAKLVVGSKGDVGQVGLAARFGIGAVLVDAVHAQSVKLVEGPHPLGVPLRQVVVYRHQVHTPSAQCVEVNRQGSDQGFALTRSHFGDAPLVEHHAAEELHVVVHHIPCNGVARGQPLILPNGGIAIKFYGVDFSGHFAVPVGSGQPQGPIIESARSLSQNGKGPREQFN